MSSPTASIRKLVVARLANHAPRRNSKGTRPLARVEHRRRARMCASMAEIDRERIWKDFGEAVNMSATELDEWLRTQSSRKVGWKGADGTARESVGHASGRSIVKILRKPKQELSAGDYAHMRKVVGYIRRHSAQRPANIYTSRWRYSLMNWGHDPAEEDKA